MAARIGSGHTRLETTDVRCALLTSHMPDVAGVAAGERLPLRLDVRLTPTQTRHSGFTEAARRQHRPLQGSVSAKQPLVTTRTLPGTVVDDGQLSAQQTRVSFGRSTTGFSRDGAREQLRSTAEAAGRAAQGMPRLARSYSRQKVRSQLGLAALILSSPGRSGASRFRIASPPGKERRVNPRRA